MLEKLGRHRWTMVLIAALQQRGGGRFVELANMLGVSRESLSRTLEAAIVEGWVMRNPGHGHPLRPEYILTDAGKAASSLCVAVTSAQGELALSPASLSRWSLPVLHLAGKGEHRFAAFARALPNSNPRALTQSLKTLIGQHLLDRRIIASYPPVPEYHLLPKGQRMAEALG